MKIWCEECKGMQWIENNRCPFCKGEGYTENEAIENYAKIGMATKKLCECYGGTIACHFESVEDLLNWAEEEGK